MNCKGIRVTDPKDLPAAMAEFLETTDPVILDVVVEKNEHVLPMVPAGKALHEVKYILFLDSIINFNCFW